MPDMEQEIKKLRRKRGSIQASITNFTKIFSLDEAPDPDYVQVSLESMQRSFEKFDTIQDELEELDEENEIPHRETIVNLYNMAVTKARKYIRENVPKNDNSNIAPSIRSDSGSGDGHLNPVKLPNIHLPKFSGSIEEWAPFHDLFSSLIDQNPNLSRVAKLQYLRSSVTDKAARLIQSLETTDDNYEIALSLLKNKFNHPRRAMRRHWAILRDFPKLQRDTPSSLGQLVDVFTEQLKALENLGAPIDQWSVPVIDLILSKVSPYTAGLWEFTLEDNNMPPYSSLLDFLERKANSTDFTANFEAKSVANVKNGKLPQNKQGSVKESARPANFFSSKQNARKNSCLICQKEHALYLCPNFKVMPTEEKRKFTTDNALCFNCLRGGHSRHQCKCESVCRICKEKHHTSLCVKSTSENETKVSNFLVNAPTGELITTAVVDVLNHQDKKIPCRTLLDTGSTNHFMSGRFLQKLGLKKIKLSQPVDGLNNSKVISLGIVNATVLSKCSNFRKELTFHVVDNISNFVPNQPLNRREIAIPKNLKLADPDFHKPAPLDILFSSGMSLSLFCAGQIHLTDENGTDLFLQKTRLGWVIGGSAPSTAMPSIVSCHLATLDLNLTKFWSIEEGPTEKHLSEEEIFCEDHFIKHVSRETDGRYSVALPFNENVTKLGESKAMALKRFLNLTRKLSLNPDLEARYEAVMQEYIDLQHMTPVSKSDEINTAFVLPHHAVIKESSMTTAVRVVFDGSAKSTSGVSLNDALAVGPTIQPDLFTQLLRFRENPIVLTGDIEKMYRQFIVTPEDRKFQRIFWRDSNGQPKMYELNRVTFGLTSASFLATRCLHQLADDEAHDYPIAASFLKENLYVDDALLGFDSVESARLGRNQLIALLKRGGIKIRSWASNNPELLEDLPSECINRHLILNESSALNTLGVKWDSKNDSITYSVAPSNMQGQVTKRAVLSDISKLFDPLGLLAPVLITGKIFIQKMWKMGLDWDESLPLDLQTQWIHYRKQLQSLTQVNYVRYTLIDKPIRAELHGFTDASNAAYGVCIYLRSENEKGQVKVSLLCAKSRVAPVKTISIPRLELCGARLLSNLVLTVKESMKIKFDNVTLWTDSSIVLNWLQTSPARLQTFVANRVSEIQSKTRIENWQHVRSPDNPADLVSRGLMPKEFLRASIWQHGPSWLKLPRDNWPVSEITHDQQNIPEMKRSQCFLVTNADDDLLTRYSSIFKLQRIVALCLRFKIPPVKHGKFITVAEMDKAMKIIIGMVQRTAFSEELRDLSNGKSVGSHSHLLPLAPFLDKDGLVRVGGRLRHSALPFSQRHPLLVPKSHPVTRLLIEAEHRTLAHAGPQATLYSLRRRFWLINGRSEVRQILRKCVTCSKLQPPSVEYLMGDLPAARVSPPPRAFSKVGIDFCGPFYIKEKKYRNRGQIKSYVAIFVCFATKAVHLELTTELTTESFIAALKRFIARRGICSDIFSDNAKNFVGARNQLKDLYDLFKDENHMNRVHSFALSKNIRWHFIPARSPHFGGLWESAVRSFKHHLLRLVGSSLFTYEEFYTFCVEIEAILNSRPLSPLSSDPNDLLVLTPAHFLIGDSLTGLPNPELQNVPKNRMSHWQHLQNVKLHFWRKWSREYLSDLNVRHKWTKHAPAIQEGALVLLKEDNLPPLHWLMGRVIKCHPGNDGITRVVTVKTARGANLQRSVKNLAPLPIQEE